MKTENQKTEKGIINSTALSINEKSFYAELIKQTSFIQTEINQLYWSADFCDYLQQSRIERHEASERQKALDNIRAIITNDLSLNSKYIQSDNKTFFVKQVYEAEYARIKTELACELNDFI